MLARSKINSIESKMSKALIDNEEKKYLEMKQSIRMINNHRSDAEKVSLIEEAKKNRY